MALGARQGTPTTFTIPFDRKSANGTTDPNVQVNGNNLQLDSKLSLSFTDLNKITETYNLPAISSVYSQSQLGQNWQTVSFNSLDIKYTSVGASADHGGINAKNPNIYFNIKKNTFLNNDMLFRFRTSSLTSGSSAASTWSCDSTINSNFTLTADSGSPLVPVSAYGKYFYELTSGRKILNNSIKFRPALVPTYTVLVFALARESSVTPANPSSDFSKLMAVNQIHKFVESTYSKKIYNLVRFTEKEYQNGTNNLELTKFNLPPSDAAIKGQYFDTNLFIAPFAGSPLNNSNLLKDQQFSYTDTFIDTYNTLRTVGRYSNNKDFFVLMNPDTPKFGGYLQNLYFNDLYKLSKSTKYNYLPFNNISKFPTDINNPTTAQPVVVTTNGGGTVNLTNFSLFFVEMFSFPIFKGGPNQEDLLCLQTFVNGMLMANTINTLNNKINFTDEYTYLVQLSNLYDTGTSDGNTKMYLFDYSCGKAKNINSMYRKSRSLIESLAYDYRNILIKSSSDLQICSSAGSLNLVPLFSHPFLNMFFK